MIESVAGALVNPRPPPSNTICNATCRYETSTLTVATQANAAVSINSPTNTTALVPIRVTASALPSTEPMAIEIATGRIRTPVSSGP